MTPKFRSEAEAFEWGETNWPDYAIHVMYWFSDDGVWFRPLRGMRERA